MNPDPCLSPAHVLARDIAARRLSPVDLVEALLARIAAYDPKLHAFIDVYAADARLAAEAADKAIRAGHALGPFPGVPIAIKDIIATEGRITTRGSATPPAHRATTSAPVAAPAIGQGSILLRK